MEADSLTVSYLFTEVYQNKDEKYLWVLFMHGGGQVQIDIEKYDGQRMKLISILDFLDSKAREVSQSMNRKS